MAVSKNIQLFIQSKFVRSHDDLTDFTSDSFSSNKILTKTLPLFVGSALIVLLPVIDFRTFAVVDDVVAVVDDVVAGEDEDEGLLEARKTIGCFND